MTFTFAQIISWLITYKYFVMFPITIFEGPIIAILAGFLSSLGYLDIFISYTILVIGDLAGDSLFYALGYWGRNGFIHRWGRFIGLSAQRMEYLESHFHNHGGKTLIIGKLSHVIGTLVLIVAGAVRMPFWKFLWYNLIPAVPKSLLLILIGFYFGQAYVRLNKYLDYTTSVAIILTILLIFVYFIMKRISKKLEEKI